jgi:hypothetical protein
MFPHQDTLRWIVYRIKSYSGNDKKTAQLDKFMQAAKGHGCDELEQAFTDS